MQTLTAAQSRALADLLDRARHGVAEARADHAWRATACRRVGQRVLAFYHDVHGDTLAELVTELRDQADTLRQNATSGRRRPRRAG